MAARVESPIAADGTAAGLQGNINANGDSVLGTSAPAGQNYCVIDGSILASGSGVMSPFFGSEVATLSGVRILAGAVGICWAMA
jgi:hypothetical protein